MEIFSLESIIKFVLLVYKLYHLKSIIHQNGSELKVEPHDPK